MEGEHSGMKHDRDADDDSDDLTPGEKALIAAANGNKEAVHTSKFSKIPDIQDSEDQKRNSKEEDSEDQLSAEERKLVSAANLGAKKSKPKKAAKIPVPAVIKTKALSMDLSGVDGSFHKKDAEDALSPDERALISAANHGQRKAQHAKVPQVKASGHLSPDEDKRTPTTAANRGPQKAQHKKVPQVKVKGDNFALEEKKLREDSDELSPEEQKLIHAASSQHTSKQAPSKPVVMSSRASSTEQIAIGSSQAQTAPTASNKSMMKRAMEKITKAAAQQAVAAQTEGLSHVADKKVSIGEVPAPKAARASNKLHTTADARSVVFGKASTTALPTEKADTAKIMKKSINIQHTPHKSFEQKLADLDRHAMKMATADSGPLSDQELNVAEDMAKKLRGDEKRGVVYQDVTPVDPRLMDAVMGGRMSAP